MFYWLLPILPCDRKFVSKYGHKYFKKRKSGENQAIDAAFVQVIVDGLLMDDSVDDVDAEGYTPLMLAMQDGISNLMVGALLRSGARPDISTQKGSAITILKNVKTRCENHGREHEFIGVLRSLMDLHCVLYYNGVDPTDPYNEEDGWENPVARDIAFTSRTLCLTTLLADDSVYLNMETTQELVQMLRVEYSFDDDVATQHYNEWLYSNCLTPYNLTPYQSDSD